MTADPIPLSEGAPIRVLLIEDDEKDYQRICDLLDAVRHVAFAVDWAQSVEDATARLGMDACDVWLVDHGLPDGKGLDLVRAAHDRGLRAPIVMLTGCGFLDLDLEAMALGASDFLDKSRLDTTLLERTIRYALARHRQAERLNRLAQYDELTGLANRSHCPKTPGFPRGRERTIRELPPDCHRRGQGRRTRASIASAAARSSRLKQWA
jgi:DNA-binding response OmpR family regulator